MRSVFRSALALVAATALFACDDDPVSPETSGRIRVLHAVADMATMDVLLNSTTYKNDLAFKSGDGYKEVATGANTVRLRVPDATTDLHTANVTVADGAHYTVLALGTQAAPQSVVLTDNNAAPAAGKVKLRFVHGAAALGAVDVYVLDDAEDLEEATPVKANLAAKASSDYIVRDAGTYVVIFTTAGAKTPVLTINSVQVAAGKISTIVAVEKAGGGQPLESIVQADN